MKLEFEFVSDTSIRWFSTWTYFGFTYSYYRQCWCKLSRLSLL